MRGGNDTGVWCAEITGAAEKPKLAQRKQIIVMAQNFRLMWGEATQQVSGGGALIKGEHIICFKNRKKKQ